MVNHDLIREVLRLKDAFSMFPQNDKPKRILNVRTAVMATDRPASQMEWWLHIMNGGCPTSITKYIQPVEEKQPARAKLTQSHKDTLKSLSYQFKPTKEMFSVAA